MAIIVRYGEPNIYDQATYGTICKSPGESIPHLVAGIDIYVQMSEDESNPKWTIVGNFPVDTDDSVIEGVVERFLNFKV